MDVQVNGAYKYFTIPIFGGIDITQSMVSVFLVTVILMVVAIILGKRLTKRPGKVQVLVETGVTMMHNMVCDTMGKHNAHWTPYITTIFLSSIFGSLIGMTGFLRSSTADLSVPLVWAVMTTAIIWYQNIKHNGFWGWLKGFAEPVVVMTPMNIISEIAQPVSMAFRHFGNVAGGSVITAILYTAMSMLSAKLIGLASGTIAAPIVLILVGAALLLWGKKIPKLKNTTRIAICGLCLIVGVFGLLQYTGILKDVPALQFGIPAVLSVYFDLFSGFVQAFVFSLLSMVYIAGACPPPEETEAGN